MLLNLPNNSKVKFKIWLIDIKFYKKEYKLQKKQPLKFKIK